MPITTDQLKKHNEYLLNEVIIPNRGNTCTFVDHTGAHHGKLTAIKYLGINKNYSYKKIHYYLFECECGNHLVARYDNVRNGKTSSCGCTAMDILLERSTTHSMCHTRLYNIYNAMIGRCYRPSVHNYSEYGGRGIYVYNEWLEKDVDGRSNYPGFMKFYNWAMENGYNDTLSIDRIDVDGPYCPENCRWSDNKMQTNNQQRTVYIYYKSWVFPIKIWEGITGISTSTIKRRLNKGWNVEQSLRIPNGYGRYNSEYLTWEVPPKFLKYHRPDKANIAIK